MTFALLLIGYTLFDRIGYNLSRKPDWSSPWHWHALKLIMHLLIILFCPWRASLAFEICFWTFGLDWLYYATTRIPLNVSWLDTWQDTKRDFANGITHAWWSVQGFLWCMFVNKRNPLLPVPVSLLATGAIIGFVIALIILGAQ